MASTQSEAHRIGFEDLHLLQAIEKKEPGRAKKLQIRFFAVTKITRSRWKNIVEQERSYLRRPQSLAFRAISTSEKWTKQVK